MNKYVIFAIIVVVGTMVDLATKTWAENNLASESEYVRMLAREAERPEPVEERVPFLYRRVVAEADGMSARDWVEEKFGAPAGSPDGQRTLRSLHRVLDEDFHPERGHNRPELTPRLAPDDRLQAGEWIEVRHRQTTVVPGFWNHVYVRNPGAAWGMFSERPESFRRPFFIIVSLFSVLLMIYIVRITPARQRLLILALATIVAGAMGNLVDRIRYGYVVDFIQWYATVGGEPRYWPTFNIADVWISVGVGLLLIDMIRGPRPPESEAEQSSKGD